jgi:hypothetical protein
MIQKEHVKFFNLPFIEEKELYTKECLCNKGAYYGDFLYSYKSTYFIGYKGEVFEVTVSQVQPAYDFFVYRFEVRSLFSPYQNCFYYQCFDYEAKTQFIKDLKSSLRTPMEAYK